MELSFKRVPADGVPIPLERRGDWHRWLFENGYWLGDFCGLAGSYSASMRVKEDGLWYIYPTRHGVCLCIRGCSVNGECPVHGDRAMPIKGRSKL